MQNTHSHTPIFKPFRKIPEHCWDVISIFITLLSLWVLLWIGFCISLKMRTDVQYYFSVWNFSLRTNILQLRSEKIIWTYHYFLKKTNIICILWYECESWPRIIIIESLGMKQTSYDMVVILVLVHNLFKIWFHYFFTWILWSALS